MKNFFSPMYDRPENGVIVGSASYWLVCYMLIPFTTTLLLIGSYQDVSMVAVVDIVYYLINAIFMICLFARYMKDTILDMRIDSKGFLKTTAIVSGIMVLLAVSFISLGYRSGQMMALSLFPITETSVITTPATILLTYPVAGMLCTVLLCPFTVSCMFYATVFVPVSTKYPRVAYLVMALALMIPRFFNMWWLGGVSYEMWTYFVQLPFHLLACWAYQKTESIWAPVLSLAAVNLVSSLYILLMQLAGMIYIV